MATFTFNKTIDPEWETIINTKTIEADSMVEAIVQYIGEPDLMPITFESLSEMMDIKQSQSGIWYWEDDGIEWFITE